MNPSVGNIYKDDHELSQLKDQVKILLGLTLTVCICINLKAHYYCIPVVKVHGSCLVFIYACKCYTLEKIWQLQVELRATQKKVEELQQQNAAFIVDSGMHVRTIHGLNLYALNLQMEVQ